MTTTDPLLESLADDLLLTVDHVAAGRVDDLTSRVSERISAALVPELNAWIGTHPTQRKGALAAAQIVASATARYVAAQSLLATGLLSWASEQTGRPVGEVLAGARAGQEDV